MSEFLVRVLAELPASCASDCLRALPADARPVLLDDAVQGAQLLAWNPDRSCLGKLKPRPEGPAQHSRPGPASRWPLADHDPARQLTAAWEGESWHRQDDFSLSPAWMGYFGFECGHAYQPFPWASKTVEALPDYAWARYRFGLLFEGERLRVLQAVDLSEPEREAELGQSFLAQAKALLAAAHRIETADANSIALRCLTPRKRFEQAVRELRGQIGAGELFQANLSHRMVAQSAVEPRSLYAATREAQPTGMSAYLELAPDQALLSWSPEVFLSARAGQLETRPIKGTAPRSVDPVVDAALARELAASEKERAELTMIVDMARNDLGSIARAGSVAVPSAGEIEAYPTLWHRTATVQARAREGVDFADLLAACFPPASVTGAPKVRALQAIVEAEGEARGAYCGSLGYWLPGLERGELSVLIRTASVCDGQLGLRVGAGIVWDSDAEAEWQETLLKARYLEQQHEQTSL